MSLPRLFNREPKSLKGIRERSAVARGAELCDARVPGAGVAREGGRGALARSRARRAANGA